MHFMGMKVECCRHHLCLVHSDGRVTDTATQAAAGVVLGGVDDGDELEVRFIDVTEAFCVRATAMVDGFDGWDKCDEEEFTDTFHSDNVRTRRRHKDGTVQHVQKVRRASVDLHVVHGSNETVSLPCMLRVSRKAERLVVLENDVVEPQYFRRQKRRSYTAGGVRIDISTVYAGKTFRDIEHVGPSYEIEIELLDSTTRCGTHAVLSLLMRALGFATDDATTIDVLAP